MKYHKALIVYLFFVFGLTSCLNNFSKESSNNNDKKPKLVFIPGFGFMDMNEPYIKFSKETEVKSDLVSSSSEWRKAGINTCVYFMGIDGKGDVFIRFHLPDSGNIWDNRCQYKRKESSPLFSDFQFEILYQHQPVSLEKEEYAFVSHDSTELLIDEVSFVPESAISAHHLMDLKNDEFLTLRLPMHLFHSVPAGVQHFQLHIKQTNFKSEKDERLKRTMRNRQTGEDSTYYICGCIGSSFLEATYEFQLTVPEIHEMDITSTFFELKTGLESEWAGFLEASPKLFFRINYSGKLLKMSESWDRDMEVNDDTTYTLFYYDPSDYIDYEVYDFDNLNDNDLLETFSVPFNKLDQLRPKNGKKKHLKQIKIKTLYKGIVNAKRKAI